MRNPGHDNRWSISDRRCAHCDLPSGHIVRNFDRGRERECGVREIKNQKLDPRYQGCTWLSLVFGRTRSLIGLWAHSTATHSSPHRAGHTNEFARPRRAIGRRASKIGPWKHQTKTIRSKRMKLREFRWQRTPPLGNPNLSIYAILFPHE